MEQDERVICVFQHNDTETVNLNINFFIQWWARFYSNKITIIWFHKLSMNDSLWGKLYWFKSLGTTLSFWVLSAQESLFGDILQFLSNRTWAEILYPTNWKKRVFVSVTAVTSRKMANVWFAQIELKCPKVHPRNAYFDANTIYYGLTHNLKEKNDMKNRMRPSLDNSINYTQRRCMYRITSCWIGAKINLRMTCNRIYFPFDSLVVANFNLVRQSWCNLVCT